MELRRLRLENFRKFAQTEIEFGQGITGVIGPNGAGKTTLFNLITGLIPTDEGKVDFEGVDILGLPPSAILERGIARTFQNVRLFPEMTVRENVMVAQHCRTKAGVLAAIFRTPAFRREEEQIRRKAEDTLGFFGNRLVGYRFDQLAMALKGASQELKDLFFKNMSERASKMMKEDMEAMGPVRLKDVDEAQAGVVSTAKSLADSGEIVISTGGEEDELVF